MPSQEEKIVFQEWTSKYNPFNSWKALVHADRFEAILEGKPKAPIVINFDLTNKCNYNCTFCMFANRERADPTGQEFRGNKAQLPKGYALTLPKIWKEWGVKAVCLAGGGEPSLHPDCKEFIKECKTQGLELGFVTNGYLVNDKDWWEVVNKSCKFVGFSMDAGNREDYSKVKGINQLWFDKVLSNLEGLAETRKRLKTDLQIGFKFILDKDNWEGIYQAARLASEIGVNHFQFRPAIEPDYKFFEDKIENIQEQITQAQNDFDREDYKVMGVFHKFNKDLSKKHAFKKCRATMLTSTWCADGQVYMCTDTRGNPWAHLTSHYPNPQGVLDYWGSKEHFKKVKKINHSMNCDRCTLAPYNEMFEQVFIQDKMDRFLI